MQKSLNCFLKYVESYKNEIRHTVPTIEKAFNGCQFVNRTLQIISCLTFS